MGNCTGAGALPKVLEKMVEQLIADNGPFMALKKNEQKKNAIAVSERGNGR